MSYGYSSQNLVHGKHMNKGSRQFNPQDGNRSGMQNVSGYGHQTYNNTGYAPQYIHSNGYTPVPSQQYLAPENEYIDQRYHRAPMLQDHQKGNSMASLMHKRLSDSSLEQQPKPALPPKIPVISASPSIETIGAVMNNNNIMNNNINNDFYQDNQDNLSDDSSVEDLIDRYMETSLLEDATPEGKQKISRKMTLYRKQIMRLSSIVKEFTLDSEPPPYEELDHSSYTPPVEKAPIVRDPPVTNTAMPEVMGQSSSDAVSRDSDVSSSPKTVSSASLLPYPIDDPLIAVSLDEPPRSRTRRYTDDLLEELKKKPVVEEAPAPLKPLKVPVEAAAVDPVEDFLKTRDNALLDYKDFTLDIQLAWAKLLIKVIDNPAIINHYNINGQKIKPLDNAKANKKNKQVFLSAAMKILKKLSDKLDNVDSQALLGDLYTGSILPDLMGQDFPKGFEYYLKATKQRHSNATYKLGCCVEHGMGTKKDIEKCFYFYEKSALLGDPDGMCKLGIVFIKGLLNQKKSAEKSIYWLNKSILTRDTATLPVFILAKIYETDCQSLNLRPQKSKEDANIITELQRLKIYHDYKTALQLYLKAARSGHTKSQSHLGYCYEYGSMGCSVNPKASIYWYSKAAQKGDLNADMGLSGWYLTGAEGVLQQNDTEAYLWARKASEKGLAKAEYAVAYFSEVGVGTPKDLEKARKWYKIAASQGYSKAIKKLENWR